MAVKNWIVSYHFHEEVMMTSIKFNNLSFFLFLICLGCVPLYQQVSKIEVSEIEGFVGPLIIDKEKFYRIASTQVYDIMTVDDEFLPSNKNITYEGTFDGDMVYIRNCKCLEDVKIIQNKLFVIHSYAGGGSDRENTKLLWNGKYYKNSRGEYIVDLILFSDEKDLHRALLREKKILNVEDVQREGVNFIWINLMGYDRMIGYSY
jgi:hypothetical protein